MLFIFVVTIPIKNIVNLIYATMVDYTLVTAY